MSRAVLLLCGVLVGVAATVAVVYCVPPLWIAASVGGIACAYEATRTERPRSPNRPARGGGAGAP